MNDADRKLREALAADPQLRVEWQRTRKLKKDPRISRIGGFLRESSLDELPQLWNVVRGDMSLVGPRPVVEEEMRLYGRYVAHYESVRPGPTGLWQVSGGNDTTYRRRAALDVFYVRRANLWLDLRILGATVWILVSGRGAY